MSPDDKKDVVDKEDNEKPVENATTVADNKDLTPPLSFKTDTSGNFAAKASKDKKEAETDSNVAEFVIPDDKSDSDN
jgi:hypothetical protein